jgi:hypothetical protein
VSDPLDLSGSWHGLFNYPRGMPPTSFEAELREVGGTITGETREASDSAEDEAAILHAYVEGHRSGLQVDFIKRYDLMRRAGKPVSYSGTLSPDGDEITGRWNLPGDWSGTFLMVRSSRRAAEVEREVADEEL